ncbi:MAG: substrate-binding domain-containing protein [bacterium]
MENVPGTVIKLATTTSVDNSGLLGYLLPVFKEKTGIGVDVIAVGTGAALELGKKGDVDIVLVHAPDAEEEFIAGGFGVARHYIAQNEFVIVGPESDPAGIKGTPTAAEAFGKIRDSGKKFISRGDDSGTHKKELSVWKSMNVTPEGEWYIEAGQGMGAVLIMANETEAYTLTDTGTFYSMGDDWI